jgi:beta-lactamase regulating signal transducer with metallopeptidase domain
MNNWLRALAALLPAATMVLAQVTALLIVGLIVQQAVRRSAAARHAVLLWTLMAAGLCPILIAVFRLAAIPAPLLKRNPLQPLNVLFASPGAIQPIQSGGQFSVTNHLPLGGIFIALWLAGVLLSLSGLVRGLLAARRIRRSPLSPPAARLVPARIQLRAVFGRDLPPIFISDHVDVPMAVGYFRPAVLLPSSLMAHLDDQQLLQVLVHECAHALRRDGLVALFQRVLVAMFWFHPLVYLASRLLVRVREEICDNHVLRTAPAKDYAQTLLTVAESLSQQPNRWFVPALIQTAKLESRIAGILNSRRCMMTNLTSKKVAAIAMCFVGGVIVLSCFAGAPARGQDSSGDFSHVVNLAGTGDSIKIVEVRGPTDTLVPGNTYEVRGIYKLVSQEKALLMVNVTVDVMQGHQQHPNLPRQKMIVEKGEGSFALQFHLWQEGLPHVSFYSMERGNGFAARYF